MNRVFLWAVLACAVSATPDTPLAAPTGKASKAWALLKESLQDQAPLLSSIRAEERTAKSSNLRASKSKEADPDDYSYEVPDVEEEEWLEAAEQNEAEAAAMRAQDGSAADAAAEGKEDKRPVHDTVSQFEHDVSELIMGLSKSGGAATPMKASVQKMKSLITKVMLRKVMQAHRNDQRALNRLARSIRSCGSTKRSALSSAGNSESSYRSKSPLHKSCRRDEANYATESKTCETSLKQAKTMERLTCRAFIEVEKTVASQVVNAGLVKKAAGEGSENYVRRLTASVCGGGDSKGYLDRYLSSKKECKLRKKNYDETRKRCAKLSSKYSAKKMACDSMQAQMDNAACTWAVSTKDACEAYAGCYNAKKTSYSTLQKVVKKNERDRKAEWRGLKRMQCLIDAFGDARVTDSEVDRCKSRKHDTSRLSIRYPKLPKLEGCAVPELYPATAAYKREEFASLPALARGKADANECTGVDEVSTTPASQSPKRCKCERITMLGTYSAGPLIKCTNCIDVYRSQQRNSCPRGTKLFSPRSPSDWKVVMNSGGALYDPHWIVDITRDRNGCAGCRRSGMNSRNRRIGRYGWETSDDSPWWITRKRGGLRMDMSGERVKSGYAASCYLNIASARNVNRITFNSGSGCNYHSSSYYCQPNHISTKPKRGSPRTCRCSQVALTGRYSAGALIKCEQCWETSKSRDRNSCPKGTKLFSPANKRDWKTVLDSGGPLKNPDWIVDITRPQNGCGGCKSAMRSTNPRQATWMTSDGSPWWLASTARTEPNGDYHANCYIRISGIPQNKDNINFNDHNCNYKSSSYYCQPARPRK